MEEVVQETITNEQNEQVNDTPAETVLKVDYDALVTKVEELEGQVPKSLTDTEINLKKREDELFNKEVNLTLKENDLGLFAPLLKVSDEKELTQSIVILKEIVNQMKVQSGYIPKESTSITQYEEASQKKDVAGMIGAKLQGLFGK
ncbi:hypothetical protein MHH85_05035 [Viridibacillus sp. FSL E2-0187]|uniref:hypothetical protein n=1 Tax=Viridibacillus sp. FSL E2-0187 TaxID=2921362 RepID=UPI0030F7455B